MSSSARRLRHLREIRCSDVAGDRVFHPSCNNPGSVVVYGVLDQPDGGYDYEICGRRGLRLDGAAYIAGARVHLTEVGFAAQGFADFKDGVNRRRTPHASTCFLDRAVRLTGLSTSFDIRIIDYPDRRSEDAAAALDTEGFTFCIAADLPEIVGGSGSGFGYGPDAYSKTDRGTRIRRSCAVAFGLTNDTLCIRIDGRTPQAQDEVSKVGLNMRSGHLFRVTLIVGASHLALEIADLEAPSRRSFRAELPANVGKIIGASGFIGFTAATGMQSYAFKLEAWR